MIKKARIALLFLVGNAWIACSDKAATNDASSAHDGGNGDLVGTTSDALVNDLSSVASGDLAVPIGADLAAGDLQNGADVDLTPIGTAVDPLQITQNKNESNFIGDEYAWVDADDLPRSVLLTHNTQKDPANHWGGVARRMTYEHQGTTRACVGNNNTHPGFGKIISHYASTSTGSNTQGTYTRVLAGRHHAIHEYKWNIGFGAGLTAAVTVHWFFANGRNHPVYAVTYDTSGEAADAINGDSRSPYGDIQWDYGNSANVDGVGWGDHYKFRSLGDPVCKKPNGSGGCNCALGGGEGNGACWTWDGWDYSQPNTVPYAIEWAGSPTDAEMGLVQTQTYTQHESGGYWFYGNWGQVDNDGPMPEDYNWAYQLNQYELPYNGGIKSKRLSWGMNFGAVGQNNYNAIGDTSGLDGYPYQSYAVYVVLGAHSRGMVDAQVGEIETVQGVSLTASKGTVRTTGPAGVGRSDTKAYAPIGWNPIYGTWEIDASGADEATLSLVVPGGKTLVHPIFAIHGYGAATATVSLGGAALTADVDYLLTLDAGTSTAWVTLRRALPAGSYAIAIAP